MDESSNDSWNLENPFEKVSYDDPEYISEEETENSKFRKRRKLTDFFNVLSNPLDYREMPSTGKQNRVIKEEPSSESQSFVSQSSMQNVSTEPETEQEKFAKRPMLDGKFFKVMQFDGKKNIDAACQLCLPKARTIKGSLESTTNFIKHLKRIHPNEYPAYEKYKTEKQKKKRQIKTVHATSSSTRMTKIRQTSLASLSKKKLITQADFNKRVAHFVINTISAISIIDHPSFKALFDGFNVTVMGSKSLMNTIQTVFKHHQDDLKQQISKQNFVCSTADIWSTKRRRFMGVSLHWLDDNLRRVSVAIACQRFRGVHNYEAIVEMLDAVYVKYGIKNNQIIATVTDNVSNFFKAFKEFTLKDFSTNEEVESDSDDSSEEIITQTESDTAVETDSTITLPKHFRCASHTLNLIATSDCMKAISANLGIRTKHMHALDKCRKLWTRAARPGTAEILMDVLGHTLSSPGDTRWNSLFEATSCILKEDTKSKFPLLHQKLGLPNFKDNELQYLEDYCQIMKPLSLALDILQGESNTYFGFLLPTLTSLANKWKKMKSEFEGPRYFTAGLILNACLDALYIRFPSIFQLESEEAILAAITLPKFKLCWFNSLKSDNLTPAITIDSIKQMVILAAEPLFENPNDRVYESDDSEQSSADKEYDGFFDFTENDYSLSLAHIQNNNAKDLKKEKARRKVEVQLLRYLEDKRTNISMLDDYPYIKKLSLRYNTCLPSSASVERLFSFATMVNEPRRHALLDENFEKLVILKANKVGL